MTEQLWRACPHGQLGRHWYYQDEAGEDYYCEGAKRLPSSVLVIEDRKQAIERMLPGLSQMVYGMVLGVEVTDKLLREQAEFLLAAAEGREEGNR